MKNKNKNTKPFKFSSRCLKEAKDSSGTNVIKNYFENICKVTFPEADLSRDKLGNYSNAETAAAFLGFGVGIRAYERTLKASGYPELAERFSEAMQKLPI